MDYAHPLTLGLQIPAGPGEPDLTLALLAEEAGFDVVVTPASQDGGLDGWTALAWVAGVTSRVSVSPAGIDATTGPATVLGRATASLDLLSGGRVDLTLTSHDEDATVLEETVDVVRGMWATGADGPLTYSGEHHVVPGTPRGPAPAHAVTVWVAGASTAALEVAGRTGDGWSVRWDEISPSDLAAASAVVDRAALAAGRDPREVRRRIVLPAAAAAGHPGWTRPEDDGAADTVPALRDLVVGLGFSTLLVETDDPAVVSHAAQTVAPALRGAVDATRSESGVVPGLVRPSRTRAQRHPGIRYDDLPATLVEIAVEPGDAGYGDVRSTYMRGGSPGLVLRPRTVPEVVDALAFARSHDVPLAVRSGGHGISGRSTNRGGIVIDLGRLDQIEVLDHESRRVRLGPGARWGAVARELAPLGWAISSGDYGGVGVGGLATSGGIGYLVREHGLTIDHVRAVEMVLADGRVVRASDTENTDLFWAVRGAGHSVGIVTSFELEADEVGEIGFAQLVFDATDTAEVLEAYGAVVEASPRDLTAFLVMGRPQPGQPPLAQIMAVVGSPDPEVIVDRLEPLARIAPLLQQSVRLTTYDQVVALPAPGPHQGQGEPVTRSALADHITPELARAAAALVRSGQSYFFQIRSVGGAVADVPADATAYAHRDAGFSLVAFGASRDRLDARWDAMAEHFSGLYTNFETDQRPERLLDAYPTETLARLREVKHRYDPTGVFQDNFALGTQEAATTHT
ncbi:LLM class flavin-dependent oxidoreductase [Sanguibacter inulinus]|uniref:LLM class flavin-dependent oxidoreductase n=1 Tax=Sanguibacter inulinus TaxID=60922 RepID=A0A853EXD8_9MICO|nr:LLM class flavin-dependent oxidoreductase [Sanguibacter inulinus]MBF0724291.1 LLM class flavin-dependent oxidoreductase [Sanguibacter inulinus]NYS95436.1 LLM class flavin-dependent oxidoreductase [Sanguibacter inulinus]